MKYYFTSDTHFGHVNFIKGVSRWPDTSECRDFETVEEHDATLLEAINTTVSSDDVLIHLGDFCFPSDRKTVEYYREQINCKDIFVLPGNHDKMPYLHKTKGIETVPGGIWDVKENTFGIHPYMVMCHYAMRVWNKSHFGTWHLFGHTHARLHVPDNSLSMDVGVDTRADWKPYSLAEIAVHMDTKTFVSINKRK